MSKTSVGDVYAKVIGDVCEASRQDFEEGGVELATLDLLKSEWQKKLSNLKVAQLPWDPPPAPAIKEQIKEQTTVPSNVRTAPQTLSSNGASVNTPPQPQPSAPPTPGIKNENHTTPSYPVQQAQSAPQSQHYQAPLFPQGQNMTARDRAAMNLHQQYGQRAGAQIAQLQSGGQQTRVPMPSAAPNSSNYIKQEDSSAGFDGVQDYSQELKIRPQIPNPGQTDGPGDTRDTWESEYAQRKALAAKHGAESDALMRAHFQARQQELEGGGLLTTLDERSIPSKATKRKVNALTLAEGPSSKSEIPSIARAQGDATGDDDEEEDEDAINSDLDDPDDLAAAEENGENTDQVMLCTYDKVQRVKNKWKCTLKDGILRVEGNEYVFHKGQGEFEW